MDQEIEKIAPWSAKASPKGLTLFSEGAVPRPWGPKDQLKVSPSDHFGTAGSAGRNQTGNLSYKKRAPTLRSRDSSSFHHCIYNKSANVYL